MFHLSQTSLDRLEGVDPRLVAIVKEAIKITPTDFSVICGLRTEEEQKKLFEAGKTQTMNSKHLTGRAVDLAPWINGKLSWNHNDFHGIAEAMRTIAYKHKDVVTIRWGAAWHVTNINDWPGHWSTRELIKNYEEDWHMKNPDSEGGPFIDAPHWEIY